MLYHAKNSCKMDSYPEIVGAQMSRWYRVCPATPRLRGAKGSEKSRLQMFILQRGPMKAGSVHTLQYDRLKTSRISTLFFAKTREIEEIVGKTFGTGLLQAERSNWWRNIGSEGFSESGLNLAWFQQRGSSLCGPRSAPQLESIRRKMTTWKHELALCPAAWFWGSATVIAYKIRQNRSQNSYSVTVIRTHQPKFRPKVSAYFFIYYHQLGGHHFCAPRKKKIVAPPCLSLHSWHFMTWSAPGMVPSFPEAGKIYVLISLLCSFLNKWAANRVWMSSLNLAWVGENLDLNVSRFAVSIP